MADILSDTHYSHTARATRSRPARLGTLAAAAAFLLGSHNRAALAQAPSPHEDVSLAKIAKETLDSRVHDMLRQPGGELIGNALAYDATLKDKLENVTQSLGADFWKEANLDRRFLTLDNRSVAHHMLLTLAIHNLLEAGKPLETLPEPVKDYLIDLAASLGSPPRQSRSPDHTAMISYNGIGDANCHDRPQDNLSRDSSALFLFGNGTVLAFSTNSAFREMRDSLYRNHGTTEVKSPRPAGLLSSRHISGTDRDMLYEKVQEQYNCGITVVQHARTDPPPATISRR